MTIRLVTFDALHTLVTPRLPIYTQYSQTFAPYLGVLEPVLLKQSFKVALSQVQKENPTYQGDSGAEGWWSEVIKRTAIGAGADPQAVDSSLPQIVPSLMERFSSRQGYKLFHDSLPVLRRLHQMKIRTALISNTDTRMLSVLRDLEIAPYLGSILLSEAVGIEKPNAKIFRLAFSMRSELVPMEMQGGVHVGDELESDYHGARAAGMHALLLRRAGPEGDGEHKEEGENLQGVQVVNDLWGVVKWVERQTT
ncbi:HAD-like domain-containing protein [Suillus plorans]|uniref:HAD-like domain-containing protein n=1 Tax=Suillus plorans TaxID=116603 RepID=A0A9P7J4S5_9AGAM|nr:HAD-like domain-containing protein [Suillus plorans]KAG1802702.1 HAD-like domain-containing protein [Suillus plorans]